MAKAPGAWPAGDVELGLTAGPPAESDEPQLNVAAIEMQQNTPMQAGIVRLIVTSWCNDTGTTHLLQGRCLVSDGIAGAISLRKGEAVARHPW
jgi:hypothetical protein